MTDSPTHPTEIAVLARGLWTLGGCVLLCKNIKRDYWYLPGGHVEPGETATHALQRELLEEARLDTLRIGACVFVEEHIFMQRSKPRHEYTFVFHVEHTDWPTDDAARPVPVQSAEPNLGFEWIEPAALADLDVRSKGVKAWLAATPGGLDTPAFLSSPEFTRRYA